MRGRVGCGKSCLVAAITGETLPKEYKATLGAVLHKCTINGHRVIIWDLEGELPGAPPLEAYLLGADLVLSVADGADDNWQDQLQSVTASATPIIKIVCKSEKMLRPCDTPGVLAVSAATGEGIAALSSRIGKCLDDR